MQHDDEDEHEVGAMQGATTAAASAIAPSWTWGSTTNVVIESAIPILFHQGVTQQLAQVSLPEPAVCSVYFQAEVRTTDPSVVLRIFNIRFTQGVGRTSVVREISYLNQPAPLAPLEVTLEFMPLHALQVDVFAAGDFGVAGRMDLQVSMIMTPLTRIPQKEQQLAFGMALPGEADDLDDELREDLEASGPTARDAVMQGRRDHDGSEGSVEGDDDEGDDDEGDDDEGDARPAVPGWLLQVVDQLTNRYGRKPTKTELRAAVQRLRARRARRLAARGRGGARG